MARGASITVSNSDLSCQVTAPIYDTHLKQALLFTQDPPKYGGAIYVENALQVVSSSNKFHNCYQTSEGSIFYLTSTPSENTFITELVEQGNSIYEQNQAQKGGVIYCDRCKLTITGTASSSITFRNNSAQEGGVIYIREIMDSVITNANFLKNYATFKGGVFSVQNSNPSTAQKTIVVQDILIEDSAAVSGIKNGEGGALHLDTVQVSLL